MGTARRQEAGGPQPAAPWGLRRVGLSKQHPAPAPAPPPVRGRLPANAGENKTGNGRSGVAGPGLCPHSPSGHTSPSSNADQWVWAPAAPATPATFRLCPWEHGSSSHPPLHPRPGRPSARWGGGRCHPSEAPTGPGGSPACTPARGRLERYPETHGRGCHVLRSLGEGQRPRPAPRCSSRAGGRYECPAPRWHAASHADGGGDGLLSHSASQGGQPG